jgi:ubiquitin C-terminal hydrolase
MMNNTDDNTNDTNDNGLGVCGLFNLGNSCYMNSAIQVLRCIPEWSLMCTELPSKDLEAKEEDSNYKNKKILASYIELTKGMLTAKNGGCRPFAFRKLIAEYTRDTIYEQFSTRMPCDGHEYMLYLLDNFHEALKKKGPTPAKKSSAAVKQWCTLLQKDYSDLNRIFTGLDKITCKCLECGNISTRWETFNMLKFAITEDNATIDTMLLNERKPTIVDDYDCDKCKADGRGKSRVEITNLLWRMPPVAFLVVRRFNEYGHKNMDRLLYNGADVTFKKLFDPECDEKSSDWIWEPIGTIDHHGSHMGGHYTAQVKHVLNKKWYLYDDETANKIDKPMFGSHTYILCMRRKLD